jgi:hypothetical protein
MKLTRRQFAIASTLVPSAVLATPMAEITPQRSEAALKAFLSQRQVHLSSMPLTELVESMLAFYTHVPVAGLRDGEDSDMLLFQWGVFDWGKGENFEFDITRQFISARGVDDDAISQVRLTAFISPSAELRELPSGNRWCKSPEDAPGFQAFILSSKAFRLASSLAGASRWHGRPCDG